MKLSRGRHTTRRLADIPNDPLSRSAVHRQARVEKRPPLSRLKADLRGVFRCQRRARVHRKRWLQYYEHSLFEQAGYERIHLIEQLRRARRHWRAILGLRP